MELTLRMEDLELYGDVNDFNRKDIICYQLLIVAVEGTELKLASKLCDLLAVNQFKAHEVGPQ